MTLRRVVVLVTVLTVAGLLVWLSVVNWDSASKIATVVCALGAVAAVGVAIWGALPASGLAKGIAASRTGKAVARRNGSAITGVRAPASNPGGPVRADRTGDAEASGGGDATSGISLN
jgi:hypothetical protein